MTDDDLTNSMGINRPSLYATYGSKHKLYLQALERYAATLGTQPVKALQREADIIAGVAAFFTATIDCVTANDGPKGCLIANVAAQDAENDQQVRDKLAMIFETTDKVIAHHLQTAQDQGQLPPAFDPQTAAKMIISIMHSFAIRARIGATREELTNLAQEFLAVLFPPANKSS